MRYGLALLLLVLVLSAGDASAAAPSSSRARPPLRGDRPARGLPGVPQDLQEPLGPRAGIDVIEVRPESAEAARAFEAAQGPAAAALPSRTRQTRLSVQPDELPSTDLARGMTVAQRARARDLARAAAAAVRGYQPALRAGVQPVPLAPVSVFQQYVGIAPDGKWGRETRHYAIAFAGDANLPPRMY